VAPGSRCDTFHVVAIVGSRLAPTTAHRRGCCTKPSAKTWAALAVAVAEGAGSAEAGQGAPRASDDLRLFRTYLRKASLSPPGLCATATVRSRHRNGGVQALT